MTEILNFLKKLDVSDKAIEIYSACLGKPPLTYSELFSLDPSMSLEDFKVLIDELINNELLLQIPPQKPGLIMHYLVLPPFKPLLNYYYNYENNTKQIPESIQELLKGSLVQFFKENKEIEMDSIFEQYQNIFKDFSESTLIEKQDVEELMEDLEELKEIKNNLAELNDLITVIPQKLTATMKTQFNELLENLKEEQNKSIENIKLLELKKKEKDTITIIETVFSKQIQEKIKDFTNKTEDLVKTDFKDTVESIKKLTIKPIEDKLKKYINIGNDFKLLYLNVISNYETVLKEFQNELIKKKEKFDKNVEKAINNITDRLGEIIEKSMAPLLELGAPIKNLLDKFDIKEIYSNNLTIDNLWLVNSNSRVLEEITNIITNSKNEILFIVPKIEKFLNIVQLQNLPKSLQIRIASSDPHTNSVIKKFKELGNLEFRSIKRDDFLGLKGDNNHIIIGVRKDDSEDPLDDIVGIGSNYKPIIDILSQIIESNWAISQQDLGKPEIKIKLKPVKLDTGPTLPEVQEKPIPVAKPETQSVEPQEIMETPTEVGFESKFFPKAGDDVGMEINNSFNLLIQRVNTITGMAFSAELEKIADLILEKRGFSVTLHKIRALINQYKDQISPFISQKEKNNIYKEIEEFKKRLL